MIHGREDYACIHDAGGIIGEDEPVMLFRAKDKHMLTVMQFYAGLIAADPHGDLGTIENLQTHMKRVQEWQSENGCKRPDV
jgi:hypothetical protein